MDGSLRMESGGEPFCTIELHGSSRMMDFAGGQVVAVGDEGVGMVKFAAGRLIDGTEGQNDYRVSKYMYFWVTNW